MKKTVFKSTETAFERKETVKDLRRKDTSGLAHHMLICHGSTVDLIQYELNKCLHQYPNKVFTLKQMDLLKRCQIQCDGKVIFKGKYSDVERFYQTGSQCFYQHLLNQVGLSL